MHGRSFALGFLTALVLLGVAGALAVYVPFFDIAATDAPGGMLDRTLQAIQVRGVRAAAEERAVPAAYREEASLRAAALMFDEMCVQCHGAPGRDPDTFARHMHPEPPSLSRAADDWTAGQLYWIVAHGIKASGMPAWEPTHDETELWQVVALVEELPEMQPERYAELVEAGRAAGRGHHPHGDHGSHTH